MIPRYYRLLKFTPGSSITPVSGPSPIGRIESSEEGSHEFLQKNLAKLPTLSPQKLSTKERRESAPDTFKAHSPHEIPKATFPHSVLGLFSTGYLIPHWIVCYDASPEAKKMWEHAQRTAKALGVKISGIYIQTQLDQEKIQLPEGVETIFSNRIEQAILEYAYSNQASLLWLGTHARKGKKRIKLGSVAENLVKEALCPVWVDPVNKIDLELKNLLIPFDDKQNLEHILPLVLQISQTFTANLYFLHILEKEELNNDKFFSSLNLQSHSKKIEKGGQVLDEILKTARDKKIDLIVMATHAEKASEKLLPSGLSPLVVRHSNCSVLVFKKEIVKDT